MKNNILIIVIISTIIIDFIFLILTIKSINSLKKVSGTIENIELSFSTLKKSSKTYTYFLKGDKNRYTQKKGLLRFVANNITYYPKIEEKVEFYIVENLFFIKNNEIIALTKIPEKASNFKKWYSIYGIYTNSYGLLLGFIFCACFFNIDNNVLSNSQIKYGLIFFFIRGIIVFLT